MTNSTDDDEGNALLGADNDGASTIAPSTYSAFPYTQLSESFAVLS